MEHLLALDILQPVVQILNLLCDVVDLGLIGTLNLARLTNRHVQVELDGAVHTTGSKPARRCYILRRKAEPVLARIGCGEGKAPFAMASLCNDTMVVIESLLDGDEDANIGVGLV